MEKRSQKFRDVHVWQKAHRFVLEAYRFSHSFPKHELYTLTSQFRRAAISIPANFVEGFAKKGTRDKIRFYNIAQGSLDECRYFLILAHDLGYGDTADLVSQLEEVGKLLGAYARAVRS